MKSPLQIYTDRLKNEGTQKISETLDPALLQISDKELTFDKEVTLTGQVYIAENHLILDLKINTTAKMPCAVCNEPSELPLSINDFRYTIELSEIPSAIFDYTEEVRNALLIRIPQFYECHNGACPQRKNISKYLKGNTNESYTPFSKLEL